MINLTGPLARKVLEKITDADVSHTGFPFMTTRDVRIGYAPALAYRVTYVGRTGLGNCTFLRSTWLTFLRSCKRLGKNLALPILVIGRLIVYGWRNAISLGAPTLRRITIQFRAGLGFLIDWNKGDFLGRKALEIVKKEGVSQKLICLALDTPLPVFGGEAILQNGKAIGQTTSGNFGYTVGKSLVLGYLPVNLIKKGGFEVNSFGKCSRAELVSSAAYDPARSKILR